MTVPADLEPHAAIICAVINQFSDGGHPVATPDTLEFFQRPFVADCLRKALTSGKFTEVGLTKARNALAALVAGDARRLTWEQARDQLKPGDRVLFVESWDIFPDCIVPAGAWATVSYNHLDRPDDPPMVVVLPDDQALRDALKEWDGEIMVYGPCDAVNNAEWPDNSVLAVK